MQKKNVLILLSGGIDSSACVCFYKKLSFKITCLFIDYGQKSARKELISAKKISDYYSVNLEIAKIKGLGSFSAGVIKGRNMFLLAAALMKFTNPNGLISIGIHHGTNYRDCQPSFAENVQKLFDIYSEGSVIIDTPFINFTKGEIWSYCIQNKVPVDLTYSCELGLNQPCGKCNSCNDLISIYETSQKHY